MTFNVCCKSALEMEQKESAGDWKIMSCMIRKYVSINILRIGERWLDIAKVLANVSVCIGVIILYGLRTKVVEFSSQIRCPFLSTLICLTIYTNRQNQDLSKNEKGQ